MLQKLLYNFSQPTCFEFELWQITTGLHIIYINPQSFLYYLQSVTSKLWQKSL